MDKGDSPGQTGAATSAGGGETSTTSPANVAAASPPTGIFPAVHNPSSGSSPSAVVPAASEPTAGGPTIGPIPGSPGMNQWNWLEANAAGNEGAGQSLPAEVVRRVNALRNLQAEYHQLESSFFEEVHSLECRYLSKYQPLYDKRLSIIKGSYEPTEAEAKCAFDDETSEPEDEAAKAAEGVEKKDGEKKEGDKTEEKSVGIPEFWLQVFRNSEVLAELIKENDDPILKHLVDVRIKMHDETPKGFTIEFEFSPNDYFTNTVLTKTYELRTGPDDKDPLSYEGPEIIKSKGCTIQWKKGKNVTVKMVKKRQKHKNRGTVRVVTKEVQAESFFNFFSPPAVPEDPEADIEEEQEQTLAQDFEIGHMLRDSIVPKAVLYYTGEAGDDESGDFDEDDEDEDEDDDDDEDDQDDDDEPAAGGHHHGAGGGRGGSHHHHGGAGGGNKHGGPPTGGAGGGKSRGGKGGGGGAGAAGPGQPDCKQQ